MIIEGDKLKVTLKAGAAISKGNVVYVSGANEVSPATAAMASKVVGVADAGANAGENIEIIIYGLAKVIASGAIPIGDKLVAANAAKVASENSVTPTFSGNSIAAHSHTENQEASYTQNATTASAGGHTPAGTISAVEHGRVLGKALEAASIDGDSIKILVCLA